MKQPSKGIICGPCYSLKEILDYLLFHEEFTETDIKIFRYWFYDYYQNFFLYPTTVNLPVSMLLKDNEELEIVMKIILSIYNLYKKDIDINEGRFELFVENPDHDY